MVPGRRHTKKKKKKRTKLEQLRLFLFVEEIAWQALESPGTGLSCRLPVGFISSFHFFNFNRQHGFRGANYLQKYRPANDDVDQGVCG